MSSSVDDIMLAALKVDLGIGSDAYDKRLTSRLADAQAAIAAEGITLNTDSEPDRDLVIMYAGWLWRERASGAAMPRMLRTALNNRVIGRRGRA